MEGLFLLLLYFIGLNVLLAVGGLLAHWLEMRQPRRKRLRTHKVPAAPDNVLIFPRAS